MCAAALAGLASTAALAARAELVPPPQGKDVAVNVMRGGKVVVPLEAFTRNMSHVAFGIDPKRQPNHGRLGEIHPREGKLNQATVVYTHGDDDSSTTDEFYFTVQRTGGGGTGRAKVTIRVNDPQPVLAAPAAIDFGEVVIGETPIRTLSLANVGGGRLDIDLKIPEPFQLETGGHFRLGRGKGADIALSFRPRTAGEFVSYIEPAASEPGTKVALRGTALAPIEVNAASDMLEPAADGSRSATINIINNASCSSDARIALPSNVPVRALDNEGVPATSVRVGPGETKTLTLRIGPENKGAYDTMPVIFRVVGAQDGSGDYKAQIDLSAPAIPSRIAIIEEPDFGIMEEGRTAKARLVATNSGGVSGDIRVKPQPPVRIVEKQETFTIPAGGSVAVELSVRLKKGETLPPVIPIDVGGNVTNVPVHSGSAITTETTATTPQPPTPKFTAPPPPPSSSSGWALNSPAGISLAADQQVTALRWAASQPGWKDPELEIYNGGYGLWSRYEPKRTPESGFWSNVSAIPGNISAWFKGLFAGIDQSLKDRTDLDKMTGNNVEKPKDEIRLQIAPQEANDSTLWRLTAARDESASREPASETFRLNSGARTLTAAEPPQPARPASGVTPPPELTIEGARAKSERHRAFLALVVPYDTSANPDPKAADYQLEQVALQYTPAGMQVHAVDSKQTGSSAKTMDLVRATGTNLVEVRAVIEGLSPGTRTFWRLKQTRANGDPLVSGEVAVATEPPWVVPWRWIIIGASLVALAAILYLRRRINQAD